MATTYSSSNIETLKAAAERLLAKGFAVGPIVVPENVWVDGNPYFSTNATNRDVYEALRAR